MTRNMDDLERVVADARAAGIEARIVWPSDAPYPGQNYPWRWAPCADCGESTDTEHYMVHNHVWDSVAEAEVHFLCIGCLETRLGRELWSGDFTHFWINLIDKNGKSERLDDRLARSSPPALLRRRGLS